MPAIKVGNVVVGYANGLVLACGEVERVAQSGRRRSYLIKDMVTGRGVWLLPTEVLSWKVWGAALTEDKTYREAFAAYWHGLGGK